MIYKIVEPYAYGMKYTQLYVASTEHTEEISIQLLLDFVNPVKSHIQLR